MQMCECANVRMCECANVRICNVRIVRICDVQFFFYVKYGCNNVGNFLMYECENVQNVQYVHNVRMCERAIFF